MEGVERFQQQVELVDLIDNEDGGAITAKVKECIEKDPGAFEEDAMVIEVKEGDDDDDDGEEIRPISPETALLEARIRNIDTQVKLVGAVQRNMAGNYAGKLTNMVYGFIIGLFLIMAATPLLTAMGVL